MIGVDRVDPTAATGVSLRRHEILEVRKLRQLGPELLQFKDPGPVPEVDFQRTYDWLVNWNLIEAGQSMEDLVDNRVVTSGPT